MSSECSEEPFLRLQKPVLAARHKAGISCHKPRQNSPYVRNPLKRKKRSLLWTSLLLSCIKDSPHTVWHQKTITRPVCHSTAFLPGDKAYVVTYIPDIQKYQKDIQTAAAGPPGKACSVRALPAVLYQYLKRNA